jgi:hypothetical protein
MPSVLPSVTLGHFKGSDSLKSFVFKTVQNIQFKGSDSLKSFVFKESDPLKEREIYGLEISPVFKREKAGRQFAHQPCPCPDAQGHRAIAELT